jgi:hypothetical protein
MKCCCSCEAYEFDIIGLYPDFSIGLATVEAEFRRFCNKYHINHKNIDIAYNHYPYIWCQKYGQFTHLKDEEWLNNLGDWRINFWRELESPLDNYINLFNYLANLRAISVFIGKDLDHNEEFQSEIKALGDVCDHPVFLCEPDFDIKPVWPGRPDPDVMLAWYNLS